MLYQSLTGDLLFLPAFELWISHRQIESNGLRLTGVRYISRKTERDYKVCASALNRYFGHLRLDEIDEGRLSIYQHLRATNPVDPVNGTWRCRRGDAAHGDFDTVEEAEAWARKHGGGCELVQTVWAYRAGANCIRKEVVLLQRMLRDAALWNDHRCKRFLKVQAVEPEGERALSREEQIRLLQVGSLAARHRFIYQYVLVALQTTAGPNELRQLKLGDIVLDPGGPFIQIPRAGAKNKYRKRTIPLITDDAVWAMTGLVTRAREMGAWSPAHYLFPFQSSRTHYDPNRAMSESGLNKPWDALRADAGMPGKRLYDLRHTGITRMAEAGVPLPVAMSFAGHMTDEMQRRYTSICMSSQRQWGAAVWGANAQDAAAVRSAFDGLRKPVAAEAAPRASTARRA